MAIRTIDAVTTWGGEAVAPHAGTATEYIEGGDVLVLRNLPFEIASEERSLLTASASDGRSKNVSFDPATGRLVLLCHKSSVRPRLVSARATGLGTEQCPREPVVHRGDRGGDMAFRPHRERPAA